jgi:hypothetical protein
MEFAGSDYARLAELNQPTDVAFAQRNVSGFDELRRRSLRGDVFADAIGGLLGVEAMASGPTGFHVEFANRVSYRPKHISVLAMSASGGSLPVTIAVRDASGRRTGVADATGKIHKDVPFTEWLRLRDGGGEAIGQLALVTTPDGDYTIELTPDANAPPESRYTLSIVLPQDGSLRHVVYDNLALTDLPLLDAATGEPHHVAFASTTGAGAPRGPTATQMIVDQAPSIISLIQQADADKIACVGSGEYQVGRIVAALFSEEVTAASVQDKLRSDAITNYTMNGNRVVGVALQPGRRIAFLAMRDPVGPFVPAAMTFNGIMDRTGRAMAGVTAPIEATVETEGGQVSGQVLRADGTSVEFARVQLFYQLKCEEGDHVEIQTFGISSKNADGQGRYTWDFIPKGPFIVVDGTDDESSESRDITFSVARHSQHVHANVVFLGRGTLEGRALAEDGLTPLARAFIKVRSLTDRTEYGAETDALGRFTVARLPVGNILIEAVHPTTRASVFISEVIPAAGAVVRRDVVLLGLGAPPNVEIKTGRLTTRALRGDGVTPAQGALAVAWYSNNSQTGVICPDRAPECAVAQATTGADGRVVFDALVAGNLRISILDQELLQEGEARIALPAGGTVHVNVLFSSGLGTVKGLVLDAKGRPVADARVGGGLSLTTTDDQGRFTLTDVPVGRRAIVAVSQALRSQGSASVDILRAGEEVNATIVLAAVGSLYGRVYAAGGTTPRAGIAVHILGRCEGHLCVVGQSTTDEGGNYRVEGLPTGDYQVSAFLGDFSDGNIVPASVSVDGQAVRANVTFRGGGGRVSGTVLDDSGQPLRATVGISGDQVAVANGSVGVGFQFVQNYRIAETSTAGKFTFDNVLVGAFTVRAAGQFSPDPVAVDGVVPQPGATVDLTLRLQPTGVVRGTVFEPDNVTPIDREVPVTFVSNAMKVFCAETSSGEQECVSIPQGIQRVTVATNRAGEFAFPLVNPGPFTLTVEDGATLRSAEVKGTVRAGETTVSDIRLVGRGAVTVQVYAANRDTSGNPIPLQGASVDVRQVDAPRKRAQGVTDATGRVRFGGGDAFAEGQFVVSASHAGFSGRAQGRVSHDGDEVTVTLFVANSSGSVRGQVFRADGTTAVVNGEVVISTGSAIVALALTDGEGRYSESFIPLGPVHVEVFEAATAQRGTGDSNIFFNGQTVDVNVRLDELAVVRGTVVEAGTLAPLKGWTVTLQQTSASGRNLPMLRTTSGVDGAFSFPGASVGPFVLTANGREVSGQGRAEGVVTRPGTAVDVPIVAVIQHPAAGRVVGAVVDASGSPAADRAVTLYSALGNKLAETTASEGGSFTFEDLPLGRYTVVARSQVTSEAGSAVTQVLFDEEVVRVVVALAPSSHVSGTVYRPGASGGREPVPNALVKIDTTPLRACQDACSVFTGPDGRFSFRDLPARAFTVVATDPVTQLSGSAGGTLTGGTTNDLEIVLAAAGSVTGRTLSATGQAKPGVIVELAASTRRLFLETDTDGRFTFPAVAFGTYAVSFRDPLGSGEATRQVAVNGAEELGDVTLDEAAPVIVSSSPANGAVGIPLDPTLTVEFSEAVNAATVSSSTLVLMGPDGPRTSIVSLSVDQKSATIRPIASLAQQTTYTLKVEGVEDLIGKTSAPRTIAFTTVDVTPPTIVEVSPAAGTHGAPIYSPVRVQFSEPVDTSAFVGAAIGLERSGAAVAGRIDYLFANTVAVFTPNQPLAEDTVYTVAIAAAADLAGNRQAQVTRFSFSTTDRTPPTVLQLDPVGGATVIENLQKQIVAAVGPASDVALVDFFINDTFAATARSAPYTLRMHATPAYGGPGDTIRVSAVATDTSGNRGVTAATTTLAVLPDQPPVVSITAPAQGLQAKNGDRVNVVVRGLDDVGVTQLTFKAHTGRSTDAAIRPIAPPAADRSETFGFDVPTDAAPGSTLRIEANALDTAGRLSAAPPIDVVVLDGTKPAVEITGASSGARVRPGQEVTIVVVASDAGGLARVGFSASGVTTAAETRTIDPARNSVATSFTLTVPPTAGSNDLLLLDASAEDRAGNLRDATRVVLAMADQTPPSVTLRTSTGQLSMVPGQSLTVLADATDEIGVTRVTLTGTGALTLTDARSIAPPTTPATAAFTIQVPKTVTVGQTLTLRAQAFDLSNNTSAPAELTLFVQSLSDIGLPPSAIVVAGEPVAVTMTLPQPAPAGGIAVALTSTQPLVASVPASVQYAAGETTKTFNVAGVSGGTASITAAIDGVPRAAMTVTVRGGVVRGRVTSDGQPVSGAAVAVEDFAGTVSTTSAPDGTYFVEGRTGPAVTVRAQTADGLLRGSMSGTMNRANGFAVIDVELVEASRVHGAVTHANDTPAGEGVRIDLFRANSPQQAIAATFTDADSRFSFDTVGLGSYLLVASDQTGNRGRVTVEVTSGGADLERPIVFLGRGTVTGFVRNGAGAVVPNVPITFRATSIFGQESRTDASGDNGEFRFERVFVGSFNVSAQDAATSTSGSASGTISSDGQTVAVSVQLTSTGTLRGTVRRSDLSPVNAGVVVRLQNGRSTVTDEDGDYEFEFVPLGAFTVTADDAGTRARGIATGRLEVEGQAVVADIVLAGQGTLVVTVTDAGEPVAGAEVRASTSNGALGDLLIGTTGPDGVTVLDRLLAGTFTITARKGTRSGTASGWFVADAVTELAVALNPPAPTGSIVGTVFAPNGQSPATSGRVVIVGGAQTALTQAGTYRFDGVPLGSHTLQVYDANNVLRAIATNVVLAQDDQEVERNLTFIGRGSVSGTVFYPGGSSASGLEVRVKSSNPTLGAIVETTTNAGGEYKVDNVAVGPIAVHVEDAALGFIGDAEGTLVDDGQPLVLDVQLVRDVILPVAQITSPPAGASVSPGQTLGVVVHATDNVGVVSVTITTAGALSTTQTRPTAAVPSFDASFAVPIPSSTPPGVLTISAQARDGNGNLSPVVTSEVTVLDTGAPSVSIVSPTAADEVDPRQPLQVTVHVDDPGGVAQVSFAASGAATASEARTLPSPQPSTSQTFVVAFDSQPPTGGSLTLTAAARDAAGNQGTATPVAVHVRDVVRPTILGVSPTDGATDVEPNATVVVTFSEQLDRATMTAANVVLRRGEAIVDAAIVPAGDDRSLSISPAAPLALNVVYTVTIGTDLRDRAGNALAQGFVSSFRTRSPDTRAPRVSAVTPGAGAVEVSLATSIEVTFDEGIDPATLTPESFRVTVGGVPVPGTRSLAVGNTRARFTPSEPFPTEATVVIELTGDIQDPFDNALVDPAGNPITTPLRYTFVTASFDLTSPRTDVVENSDITLDVRASAGLGVSSVSYTVNGQTLPPVPGPSFGVTYRVPSRATAQTLTVEASALNGAGGVVAHVTRTVAIAYGLTVSPRLTGVVPGKKVVLTYSLSSAAESPMVIALAASDTGALLVPSSATIPAGARSVEVLVTGGETLSEGRARSTTLIATSARGRADAIVAVSVPVAQGEVSAVAPTLGALVLPPLSLGTLFVTTSANQTFGVTFLSQPVSSVTSVALSTSNAAVAAVPATIDIPVGQQVVNLPVTAGANGTAVITLRSGNIVRELTIVIGTPAPSQIAPVVAPSVGVFVLPPLSLGTVFAGRATTQTFRVLVYPDGAPSARQLTLSSSDPSIATVPATIAVVPGQRFVDIPVTSGASDGEATISMREGTMARDVSLVVGSIPTGRLPVAVTQPVGVGVWPRAPIAQVITPVNGGATLGVQLLTAPATANIPVAVSSSNPAVVTVAGNVLVLQGQQVARLDLVTGLQSGVAVLTLEFGGMKQEVVVVVGTPPTNQIPVVTAPVVGVTVEP